MKSSEIIEKIEWYLVNNMQNFDNSMKNIKQFKEEIETTTNSFDYEWLSHRINRASATAQASASAVNELCCLLADIKGTSFEVEYNRVAKKNNLIKYENME